MPTKKYSFKKMKESMDPLIATGALEPWRFSDNELSEFYNGLDAKTSEGRQEIKLKVDEAFEQGTPEWWIGNNIIADVCNLPTKHKAASAGKERTFTSQAQRDHYDLSRTALKDCEEAIAALPSVQRLLSIEREVMDNKKNKVVKVKIEPKLHMRRTEAVLASYPAETQPGDAQESEAPQQEPLASQEEIEAAVAVPA